MRAKFHIIAALLLLVAGAAVAREVASNTFTALTGSGATSSLNVQVGGRIPDRHTVAVIVTGGPSACTTQLEGSLDNVVWFDLSGSQTCTSDDMYHVINKPVPYIRVNLTTFTGGTDATVSYTGVMN